MSKSKHSASIGSDPGSYPPLFDGVVPITPEQQQKKWKKEGLCEVCGQVRVEKTITEGVFRRRRVVKLTTPNVYKGNHIPCIGGHQRLINLFKGRDSDIFEILRHEKEYKKNYLKSSKGNISFRSSNNSANPPPIEEVEIPEDHDFPSDMSLLSSVTQHLEGTKPKSIRLSKKSSVDNIQTSSLNEIQEDIETQNLDRGLYSRSFNDQINTYSTHSESRSHHSRSIELDKSNHTQGSSGTEKSHDNRKKMPPRFEDPISSQDEFQGMKPRKYTSTRRNTCPTGYIPDDNALPSNDLNYHQLFTTMRENSHDIQYLDRSMQLILDSLDNTAQITPLPASWAKRLISVLQMNWEDEYIQAKSLHVFWKIISSSSSDENLFVGAGGVDFVTKAIYNHYKCLPVSLFGNNILVNLALNPKLCRTIFSHKNTTVVTAKTFSLIPSSNHKNFCDIIYTCGCALQILDSSFQNNRRSDTVDAELYRSLNEHADFFTTALSQQKNDNAFIFHIVKFLFSLSQRDDCGQSLPFLTSPKLLERIAKIMIGTFYRWEKLQILITGLVTNLVKHNHYSPTLIIGKVAPAYIQTMKTNYSSQEIQLHGCVFVRNVCCVDYSSDESHHQSIPSLLSNEVGIIEILLSSIESHKSNEAFVIECCQSLLTLAIDSMVNKEIIIKTNGIEKLYDIFQYHCAQKNHDIIHSVFMILSSLVENRYAILRLREMGFIDLILAKDMEPATVYLDSFFPLIFNILCVSIQKHIVDDSYPKSLLDYYCEKMCETSDNILKCMDLIGYYFQSDSFCGKGEGEKEINFISLIMITYANMSAVQNKACIALSKIHSKQLEYSTKLPATSSEIKALIETLRIHSDEKDLKQNACLALYFCVKSLDKNNLSEEILDDLSHVMTAMMKIVKDPETSSEIIQITCSLFSLMGDLDISLEEKSTSRDRVGIFTNAFVQLDESDEEGKLALLEFCVYLLSRNKSDAGSLVSPSFVKSIFASLSHPTLFENVAFMERCCNAIALFSMDISLMQQKVVDNVQYLESICNLMHRYDHSIPIQAGVFSIVTHLALNGTIQAYFSTQGLVGLAIECIKKYNNNKDLCEKACRALNSLVGGTEAWILEGLEITFFSFRTIQENIDNESIVESCMGVLYRVSSKNNEDFLTEICNYGSFTKITEIMMHHLHNETIQEKGCFILWSLTKLKGLSLRMCDQKIVNVILCSLLAHINSMNVQNEGLGLIKAIAVEPPVRQILLLNNCIEVVLGAMWVHYNKEVVQHFGLIALSNLSVDGGTAEVKEASERELETVANSMEAFPQSNVIQESACRYLRNLTFQPKNALKIAANDQLLQLLNIAEKNFARTCKGRVVDIRARIEEAFLSSC